MHFVNRQPQVEILRDSKSSDLSPLITERKEEVYSHSTPNKNTQLLDSLQNSTFVQSCNFFTGKKSSHLLLPVCWFCTMLSNQKNFCEKVIFHFWWLPNSIFADGDPWWSIKWLWTIWGSRNCTQQTKLWTSLGMIYDGRVFTRIPTRW